MGSRCTDNIDYTETHAKFMFTCLREEISRNCYLFTYLFIFFFFAFNNVSASGGD